MPQVIQALILLNVSVMSQNFCYSPDPICWHLWKVSNCWSMHFPSNKSTLAPAGTFWCFSYTYRSKFNVNNTWTPHVQQTHIFHQHLKFLDFTTLDQLSRSKPKRGLWQFCTQWIIFTHQNVELQCFIFRAWICEIT